MNDDLMKKHANSIKQKWIMTVWTPFVPLIFGYIYNRNIYNIIISTFLNLYLVTAIIMMLLPICAYAICRHRAAQIDNYLKKNEKEKTDANYTRGVSSRNKLLIIVSAILVVQFAIYPIETLMYNRIMNKYMTENQLSLITINDIIGKNDMDQIEFLWKSYKNVLVNCQTYSKEVNEFGIISERYESNFEFVRTIIFEYRALATISNTVFRNPEKYGFDRISFGQEKNNSIYSIVAMRDNVIMTAHFSSTNIGIEDLLKAISSKTEMTG